MLLFIIFGGGVGGGEEGTVGGTRFIIGNAKAANFRLTI